MKQNHINPNEFKGFPGEKNKTAAALHGWGVTYVRTTYVRSEECVCRRRGMYVAAIASVRKEMRNIKGSGLES